MKGTVYNSTNSTKISDVTVVLLPRKKTLKKDDRRSRDDGVRAGRGSPCAILLLQCSCQGQQGDVSQSVRGNNKTRF